MQVGVRKPFPNIQRARYQHGDLIGLVIPSLDPASLFTCLLAGGVFAYLSEVHMDVTTDFMNNLADMSGGEKCHHAAMVFIFTMYVIAW